MNSGPLWIFAPLGALVMLPVLIELQPVLTRMRALFAVAGAVDLAILGWLVAGFTPAYSADRQQLFTIEYVWDAGDRTAPASRSTMTARRALCGRLAADRIALHDAAALGRAGAASRPAPRRHGDRASSAVERRAPTGCGCGQRRRAITLELRAIGGEHSVDAPATARSPPPVLRLHARFGDEPGRRLHLRCAGRSCDGARIDRATATTDSVDLHHVGTRTGLAAEPRALVRARPAHRPPAIWAGLDDRDRQLRIQRRARTRRRPLGVRPRKCANRRPWPTSSRPTNSSPPRRRPARTRRSPTGCARGRSTRSSGRSI